ncbi:hypothetical protein H8E07_04820 [bacterium]|nr:hypothetical protein [bacterium]
MPTPSRSARSCAPAVLWVIGIFLLGLTNGCGSGDPGDPGSGGPESRTISGVYPDELASLLDTAPGSHAWRWRAPDTGSARPARLTIEGVRWSWRLDLDPAAPSLPPRLRLEPLEPDLWHDFEARPDTTTPGAWFPLPRQAVRSPYYHDLLALLQALITPRFGQRVCHWYTRPVPVGGGPAASGAVDLSGCFEAAVAAWNDGPGPDVFAWIPDTPLGTRLLHLPGQQLRPPMSASLIQRDEQGRALRLQIRVGDTYDGPQDARYARRGFAHELAHALLLWGHSLDRDHVLWRCGPLVERPSEDERRAVRLLQALPAGMDISVYGRSTELDPPGQERQWAPVAEFGLVQQARAGHGP